MVGLWESVVHRITLGPIDADPIAPPIPRQYRPCPRPGRSAPRSDCDLVVNEPKVSGRHCRLTREGGGYVVEDLNSTNGTFLKGVRVTGKVPIARGDAITLGLTTPMPWPPEDDGAATDTSPDRPRAGQRRRHRPADGLGPPRPRPLAWGAGRGRGSRTSARPTARASARPSGRSVRSPFTVEDTIYLDTHPLPAAYVLARTDPSLVTSLAFGGDGIVVGRDSGCDRVFHVLTVSGRHAMLKRPAIGSSSRTSARRTGPSSTAGGSTGRPTSAPAISSDWGATRCSSPSSRVRLRRPRRRKYPRRPFLTLDPRHPGSSSPGRSSCSPRPR